MCDPLVEVFTSNSFPIDGFFTWFKRAEVKVLLHVKLCFRNASVACMTIHFGGGGGQKFNLVQFSNFYLL